MCYISHVKRTKINKKRPFFKLRGCSLHNTKQGRERKGKTKQEIVLMSTSTRRIGHSWLRSVCFWHRGSAVRIQSLSHFIKVLLYWNANNWEKRGRKWTNFLMCEFRILYYFSFEHVWVTFFVLNAPCRGILSIAPLHLGSVCITEYQTRKTNYFTQRIIEG